MGLYDFNTLVQPTCFDCIRLRVEVDRLTRLLTSALKSLEIDFNIKPIDHDLRLWWDEHREADRVREAAEKAKEFAEKESRRKEKVKLSALRKLTEEEKQLLNLK